jgi:hypothetical protein
MDQLIKQRGYHKRKRYPDGHLGYLHVWVWEQTHKQKLPNNWVIHHIDGNACNNRPENLKAMPEWKHQLIHQNYFINNKTKASIKLDRLVAPGLRRDCYGRVHRV